MELPTTRTTPLELQDVLAMLPASEVVRLLWSRLGASSKRALMLTCTELAALARGSWITRITISPPPSGDGGVDRAWEARLGRQPDAALHLAPAVAAAQRFTSVSELCFYGLAFNVAAVHQVQQQLLQPMAARLQKVLIASCAGLGDQPTTCALMAALQPLPRLCYMELTSCGSGRREPKGLSAALAACLPSLGDRLTSLDLNRSLAYCPDADRAALCSALASLPKLQVLDLSGSFLTHASAFSLAAALPSLAALTQLHLDDNEANECAGRLMSALRALPRDGQLKKLSVSNVWSAGPGAAAELAASLASRALRGLTHLEMSGRTMVEEGAEVAGSFAEALTTLTALRHLYAPNMGEGAPLDTSAAAAANKASAAAAAANGNAARGGSENSAGGGAVGNDAEGALAPASASASAARSALVLSGGALLAPDEATAVHHPLLLPALCIVGGALARMPALHMLDLQACGLESSPAAVSELCGSLRAMRGLQRVRLSVPTCCAALRELLACLAECSGLSAVSGVGGDSGVSGLGPQRQSSAAACDDVACRGSGGSGGGSLRRVHLRLTFGRDNVGERLKELVDACEQPAGDGGFGGAMPAGSGFGALLVDLDLLGTKLTPAEVELLGRRLLPAAPRLEELQLANSSIRDAAALALAGALGAAGVAPALQYLGVAGNKLTAVGLQALVHALAAARHMPGFKRLDAFNNARLAPEARAALRGVWAGAAHLQEASLELPT